MSSRALAQNYCGAALPSQIQSLPAEVGGGTGGDPPIEIPVVFHVVTADDGVTGHVPLSAIEDQIDELNQRFAAPPDDPREDLYFREFDFRLVGVTYTADDDLFGIADNASNDAGMRQTLSIDPKRVLNIYTNDLLPGGLGYGTFPFDGSLQEDSPEHGVVLDYTVVPGGSDPNFNQGIVGVHEVGHYLGLYHTWGCSGDGDEVSDTPAHRDQSRSCSASDRCSASEGPVPVDNYMNYTFELCATRFTEGQYERMNDQTTSFRPTLVGAGWDEIRLPSGLVVGANQSYTLYDVDVLVAAGESITVQGGGTFDTDGTTLTELAAGSGWGGLKYLSGASGTLTGGTITAVAPPDCQGSACIVEPGFAVAVDDAEVTLRDLTIENDAGGGSAEGTYGVYATGSDAHVVLEEVTIEGLSGRGLAAVNHAQVRARDTQILNNDGDGIAVSSNAEVWMRQTDGSLPQSASSGNGGRGVVTASGGHVRFGEPIAGPLIVISSQGYTAVSGNAGGGLLARTGTSIQAGSSRYHRFNTVENNGAFQAKASGNGASLSVNADFWGSGNLPSVQTQGGATAFIEAYCTDAPVFDQGCTLGFIGAAPARQPGSQHAAGTRTSSTRSGATQGVSHSEGSDAPRATEATKALDRAADFYAEGQTSAAVAQLRTVVNRFAGMPEAAGALGTLGRWVPRLGAQDQRTALSVIEKETGHPVAAQRWAALAALSGARSALGQTEAALAAADALTADVEAADVEATAAADSDLHVVGPSARFWALFAGERYGEAEAAWASLAAVDAEHDETEAARLALSLATDRTAGGLRAGDPRAGDLAAERGGQATSAATPGAAGLGRPYPNPTTGGVSVPLALDAAAEVTVVVVDVLGRAVATLASGRLEAGHHALTLDTAALAPGVYVVRAEGLGAEGPGTAHTFTVVR